MHVQSATEFSLSNAAMLAFILVALACGALLCAPIRAIVTLVSALPSRCIHADTVLGLPYAMTFTATASMFYRWLSQKISAAYSTGRGYSFRHTSLFAKSISASSIAKVIWRTSGERWIALQFFATCRTRNSYRMIVIILTLVATKSVCRFTQFIGFACNSLATLITSNLSFAAAPAWIGRAYMYARLHYTHALTRAAVMDVLVDLRLLANEWLFANTAVNLWHKSALSGVLVACLELTMRQKGLCVVYHIPAQRQAPDIHNYSTFVAFDQAVCALGGNKWRLR